MLQSKMLHNRMADYFNNQIVRLVHNYYHDGSVRVHHGIIKYNKNHVSDDIVEITNIKTKIGSGIRIDLGSINITSGNKNVHLTYEDYKKYERENVYAKWKL